jgi:nitrate reductase beta subunit
MGGWGPFGESSGGVTPIAVENFHMLKERQTADSPTAPSGPGRVNLLNWDAKGSPTGLFPPRAAQSGTGRGAPELMEGTEPAAETEPKP